MSAEPDRLGGSMPARRRPRSTRTVQLLVASGSSAVALVGALVTSPVTMLLVAPLVGALAAGLVALENLDFPAHPSARRMVLVAGCGGALLVPLVEGIVCLGLLGLPVMVVGLVVGAVAGVVVDPEREDASAARRSRASGAFQA